ncbi:hypothetical protein CBR_g18795 [Chara braunii]|uniref:Uncharacterized protein n=1 Tax=Chara braunii TaxID=69332 RepID=A0A388KWF1_CHABU|nr:hypothetical protein CBR_g18795 [Chara braunii]|eukprot:GBG74384.1 hypothetical protein CBR_g18795 [Chara braunii]
MSRCAPNRTPSSNDVRAEDYIGDANEGETTMSVMVTKSWPSQQKHSPKNAVRQEMARQANTMRKMKGAVEQTSSGGRREDNNGKRPATGRSTSPKNQKSKAVAGALATEGKPAVRDPSSDPNTRITPVAKDIHEEKAGGASEKRKRKSQAGEGGNRRRKARKGGEDEAGTRQQDGEPANNKKYNEAATFFLEYKLNNRSEYVLMNDPQRLLIDPRRVCEIPRWEHNYNYRSLDKNHVDEIKSSMLHMYHTEPNSVWEKQTMVLAPIRKEVE